MDKLPKSSVDRVANVLTTSDISACSLVCKAWRRYFQGVLWGNLHLQLIKSQAQPRNICVDEFGLRRFCLQLMRGQLVEVLAHVHTLTLTMPLLSPVPSLRPKHRESVLARCDYTSLCHYLLKNLSARVLDSLTRVKIHAVELAELYEIPVLRNFVLKFPQVKLDLDVVLDESASGRLNYGLDLYNLRGLKVKCRMFEDAYALCGATNLQPNVQHVNLHISSGRYEAHQLRSFLLETQLKRLEIYGDVVASATRPGIVWLPRSLEKLSVIEVSQDIEPNNGRMMLSALTSLTVDIESGWVFGQVRAPNLERLRLSIRHQRLPDTLIEFLDSCTKLHRLNVQGVAYPELANMVKNRKWGLDSLVMRHPKHAHAESGAMEIARTCRQLNVLVAQLELPEQAIIAFLTDVIRHNPRIHTVFIKITDLALASSSWLSLDPYTTVYDGYELIHLPQGDFFQVNIPVFKQWYGIKSGLELTVELLHEKLLTTAK